MSKDHQTRSFTIPVIVRNAPNTVDEFNALDGGSPTACVEYALDKAIFHHWLPKFRTKFVKRLEAEANIPRQVTGKGPARKDGTQPDVYEKDTVFVKRVCASKGTTPASYTALAQEIADTIPLDLTGQQPVRVNKEYTNAAEEVFAAIEAKKTTLKKVVKTLQDRNPGLEVALEEDGSCTVDALALAIRIDRERIARDQRADLFGG